MYTARSRYGSRSRYRGLRARKSNSYTKGFLIFLAIGIFMYVFIAGATGKWVADNIVLPVISMVSGNSNKGNTSGTRTNTNTKDTDKQNTASVSETITLDKVSAYLLQFGAFSQSANAETEAKNARNRGAAGFILEGDGYYRVIASAYNTVDELKSVQTRLKDEESQETGSYLLESQGLELKVSGTKDQLDALKDSFNAVKSLRETLNNIVIEFDKQNITQADCLTKLKTISDKIAAARESMTENAKSNTIAASLVALLNDLANQIGSIKTQDTTAAFSAQIKYAQVYSLNTYHQFILSVAKQ